MVDWSWEIEQADIRHAASNESRKNGATKYWYYMENWVCPLCGGENKSRERMYTPKPEDWQKRHRYLEVWDYCDL